MNGIETRGGRPAGGTVTAIASDLASAVRDGSRAERAGYLVAAVLVASGVFHFGVLVATGGTWTGPLSWRKPMTFGLSFGLTLATVTWVLSFTSLRGRTRSALITVLAPACAVEVAVITAQAWRGLPSHFIPPGGGAGDVVAGLGAAAGAVAIIATVLAATIATWRDAGDTAPSMRLALRSGFLTLTAALALGVLMLARGQVLARGQGDVPGAFEFAAQIKPGHAAMMHGVLVLPALAWFLRFSGRPESFRVAVVRTACLGYLAFAGVVVAESLAGVAPLTAAPPPAAALMIVGVLMLAGAVAAAVRSVLVDARRDATT